MSSSVPSQPFWWTEKMDPFLLLLMKGMAEAEEKFTGALIDRLRLVLVLASYRNPDMPDSNHVPDLHERLVNNIRLASPVESNPTAVVTDQDLGRMQQFDVIFLKEKTRHLLPGEETTLWDETFPPLSDETLELEPFCIECNLKDRSYELKYEPDMKQARCIVCGTWDFLYAFTKPLSDADKESDLVEMEYLFLVGKDRQYDYYPIDSCPNWSQEAKALKERTGLKLGWTPPGRNQKPLFQGPNRSADSIFPTKNCRCQRIE